MGPASLEDMARCSHLLPLLGLLEALLVAPPLLAHVDPLLAATLSTILHVIITGGLHLDGLADYMDAVTAGARGEKAQRIMKDPRLGTGGAVWATLLILAGTASLAVLAGRDSRIVLTALIASYVTAAYSMLHLAASTPPEPYRGIARLFQEEARANLPRATLQAAALLAIPAAAAPLPAAAAVAAGLAVMHLVERDVAGRLGYSTGDTLGAVYEAVRSAALVAAALAASPR